MLSGITRLDSQKCLTVVQSFPYPADVFVRLLGRDLQQMLRVSDEVLENVGAIYNQWGDL
jgi:hypothetical protein